MLIIFVCEYPKYACLGLISFPSLKAHTCENMHLLFSLLKRTAPTIWYASTPGTAKALLDYYRFKPFVVHVYTFGVWGFFLYRWVLFIGLWGFFW